MSGLQSEMGRKKQLETSKARAKEAMKREAEQAAALDSRLGRYVGRERAELRKGAMESQANRNLREG